MSASTVSNFLEKEIDIDGMTRLAYSIVQDARLAEDVVSEAMERAYEYRNSYKPHRAPIHRWFMQILVNCARKAYNRRKEQRQNEQPLEPDRPQFDDLPSAAFQVADANPGPDAQLEAKEIWEAVQQLPDKKRLVVILRYQQGLQYHEIAQVLRIPMGTVQSCLAGAHNTLRHTLSAYDTSNRPQGIR